jgi:hypothetical protein
MYVSSHTLQHCGSTKFDPRSQLARRNKLRFCQYSSVTEVKKAHW